MKDAMITGAGGFMGRALTAYLAERGIRVYAQVSPEHLDRVRPHKLVQPVTVPIDTGEELEGFLEQTRPDVMYHLAWHGMSSDKKGNWDLQMSNLTATMHVLGACAHDRVGRVVIPGSTSEYAYCGGVVTGRELPSPGDPYAAVKAALQVLCRQYAQREKIHLCWLLISGVYGPGRTDANVLSETIRTLLRGEDMAYTGLEQMWDYLYVDDLLRAMELIGDLGQPDAVYPVGSGKAEPLRNYIETVYRLMAPERSPDIGRIPYKNGKVPDSNVPDISRLRQDTGFSPTVSFEDGIRETIRWFREEAE